MRCGVHKPLSKTYQAEMLIAGDTENAFHNNCVGKHLTMLALCKKLGFSTADYDELEHPLQQLVIKKVSELCALNTDYPLTKDGCGVPVMSMPLGNMVLGFLNLFCNPKYERMKNAILQNPYIYGGEDRTDTKIVEHGLIAKVGAGGLCIVINTEKEEGFVVKVCDSDMKTRELVTIDYINRLGWGKKQYSVTCLANAVCQPVATLSHTPLGNFANEIPSGKIAAEHSIKTLHGEKVGEILTLFAF